LIAERIRSNRERPEGPDNFERLRHGVVLIDQQSTWYKRDGVAPDWESMRNLRSVQPPQYQIRRPLGHRGDGNIGVARDHRGDDRSVHHSQGIDTSNPQRTIHHLADTAGAAGMVHCDQGAADMRLDLRARSDLRPGRNLRPASGANDGADRIERATSKPRTSTSMSLG